MHDDADLVHEIPEMEVYTTLPGHGVALHGHGDVAANSPGGRTGGPPT